MNRLYTGAHRDREDERDFAAAPILKASKPIDWKTGFTLPEPPNTNQGSSSSCVSHAFSYLHWQLKGKLFSRRDLYSRIFLPNGGAFLRDGAKEIVGRGQCTQEEVPDPTKPTEQAMRVTTGTDNLRSDDKEYHYFSVPNNMESIAKAIRDYKGCVIGVTLSDEGWINPTNPRPPKKTELTNGHAIHGYGYGLANGKKFIKLKSSWCRAGQTDHYLFEDYIPKYSFNPWCLIGFSASGIQPRGEVFQYGNTLGVAASDEDTFKKLLTDANIPYKTNEDGTLDYQSLSIKKI